MIKPTSKIIIIADTPKQAFNWVSEHNLKPQEYILATTIERVRGLKNLKYVVTGTCQFRDDFERIIEEIEAHGCTELEDMP